MGESSYQVKLDFFQGPLDLLLHLIKKEEMDIYDIPIARITDQYLGYIKFMRSLDLRVAGEFLVMAATLLRIKAEMLLPRTKVDEAEGPDPREDLAERLIEYKKFKELAEGLKGLEEERSRFYPRGEASSPPEAEQWEEINPFLLWRALREALDKAPRETPHTISPDEVTLKEKMDFLLRILEGGRGIRFTELLSQDPRRIALILIFVAILELAKQRRVTLRQEAPFGEIIIYPLPG
jgi:segregation and condensation protein A